MRLKPYVPGLSVATVRQQYGLNRIAKLASNENPLGPSPRAIAAIRESAAAGHIYPEPVAGPLRATLAGHLGLPEDWVMAGNGSDELLRLLAAAYVHPGDRVVVPGGSFPNYRAVSELFSAAVLEVPLKAEAMDLEAMADLAPDARFIFLCSPNNPTGAVFTAESFRRFLAAVPQETLIVWDQAYYEFDETAFDAVALLPDHPNLILTRTFSKAYGLGGLRIGYGMARPELWAPLYMVREPFSINAPAQAAALAALADQEHLAATLANNRAGRAFLEQTASDLGLTWAPSRANFLFIDLGQPAEPVFRELLKHGVIVRPCGGFGRPNCIRVTAGLPADNALFAGALREVLR
jgi:histidinol-phosphate aminotransferase